MLKTINPGVYDELSNEEYHECAGLSASAIKLLLDCPARYYHKYLNPNTENKKDTEALLTGSAFHTLVLEPHEFDNRYVRMPHCPKNTKVGLALYNDIVDKHPGKIYLPKKIWSKVDEMHESVLQNEGFLNLFQGEKKIEQSILFRHEKGFDVLLKSRPDFYNDFLILDIKSCDSVKPRDFQKQVYDFGYHIQAALAIDALRHITGRDYEHFVMLAVEKTPPYLTALYALDDEAIAFGRQKYMEAIEIYLQYRGANSWPGYSDQIETIGLPKWAN